MSYGAITKADAILLEDTMTFFKGRTMRLLEIGVHSGSTARGIRDFCAANEIALEYWGIDNGVLHRNIEPPFDGAKLVVGDSAEVFYLVPDILDVVIIDGAHSRNHVILDTYNYSTKVAIGGFVLFHDTAPEIQHTMREAYGPDIPQFYNCVNEALVLMGWPWCGWSLYQYSCEHGQKFGGFRSYIKIP